LRWRLRLRLLAPVGEGKKLIAMRGLGGLLNRVNRPVKDRPNLRKKLHAVRGLDNGRPVLERITCLDFNNGLTFGKDTY
jgi:hypothetical protein